ncbi:hypothetical protein PHYPSEUDO_003083 [Phytophthora pseudosyringae]|uniref:Uncharacterized protein n=1 Tax=Phytophthora pseudosyringae TaxID=221518 RepID=A0A8T1WDS8_9STRA|nr:hypothetical protein PHYPSEUDO_003083 [Phytophthora pseudosyringae]
MTTALNASAAVGVVHIIPLLSRRTALARAHPYIGLRRVGWLHLSIVARWGFTGATAAAVARLHIAGTVGRPTSSAACDRVFSGGFCAERSAASSHIAITAGTYRGAAPRFRRRGPVLLRLGWIHSWLRCQRQCCRWAPARVQLRPLNRASGAASALCRGKPGPDSLQPALGTGLPHAACGFVAMVAAQVAVMPSRKRNSKPLPLSGASAKQKDTGVLNCRCRAIDTRAISEEANAAGLPPPPIRIAAGVTTPSVYPSCRVGIADAARPACTCCT